MRGNKICSKRLDPITPDAALHPRRNGILNPDALELTPLRHERSLDDLLFVEGPWANSRISVKVTIEKKDWNFNWSVTKHSTCLNVRAPNTATTGISY